MPLEYKDTLKGFSWCIHRVFNHSTLTKNEEDIGLKIKKMSTAIFSKELHQTITHLFMCFLHCSFISNVQRTLVTLSFVCPRTKSMLNLVNR